MHIRKKSEQYFQKKDRLIYLKYTSTAQREFTHRWVSGSIFRQVLTVFLKIMRANCSMCCILRTYFRGNWQSQGGVRRYYKKCTYARKASTFLKISTGLHFFYTKIRFALLATKIIKNNKVVFKKQFLSMGCQVLSIHEYFGADATLHLGIAR